MNSNCLSFRMFLLAITLIVVFAPCRAADMSDLKSVESWQNAAPGIWIASLGDMQGELRYTQFAAAPPKHDALNQLSKPKFPFAPSEITYLLTPDNKIMIRIPTGADEKLYGFGLQLDGIKKSRRIMTLNMDHWSKGGGRTHAPEPPGPMSRRSLRLLGQRMSAANSLPRPSPTARFSSPRSTAIRSTPSRPPPARRSGRTPPADASIRRRPILRDACFSAPRTARYSAFAPTTAS